MGAAKPPLLWLRFDNEASQCPGCASTKIVLLDAFKIPRDPRGRRVAFLTGCRECGLLFANPLPTQTELERHYAHGGAWAVTRKVSAAKPPARPAEYRDPRDVLLEALEPFIPIKSPPAGARVLDFGCGEGKFLDRLLRFGWRTYGIEPSTDAPFTRHQRLERPPQDASFDFAILHHVLEHVTEPLDILRAIAGALRQNAMLFIGVPRLDTLPQHGDFKYCIDGRHHLLCLSEACLRDLLARAGFSVTARLDASSLDDQITGGKPLRLRIVAQKTGRDVARPLAPLDQAVRTLSSYSRRQEGLMAALHPVIPTRMRAALLDRAIERRARERRAAKTAAVS